MRRFSSFIEEIVVAHDIVKCKAIGNKDLGDFENKTIDELKDDMSFNLWIRDNMNNPPPNGEDGKSNR